ncbi:uncharacterized protein BO72DRAFT_464060 [Aspergillus fijiensis CBS 313.89]|uniref:CCHC-type domain-containing protein n=1 Tax=Aspergillus fijiensis CBS 313.89 TaxID=1448319 RepID=A0A8G1VTK0_9EURO|nr:uncharacterized protein BO72DRAFT_464060 [Aspergillus fijiensis CBS 313.89]RAK71148.1 hypothetical protein BO72DRAFT_464060 [Aspergillus fijiensis CBS 313.89]
MPLFVEIVATQLQLSAVLYFISACRTGLFAHQRSCISSFFSSHHIELMPLHPNCTLIKMTNMQFRYVIMSPIEDRACFECGEQGHLKAACPRIKNRDMDKQARFFVAVERELCATLNQDILRILIHIR